MEDFAISFHETFSFSRSSISIIIGKCIDERGCLDREALERTPLGNNYRKVMPIYARRAGLLNEKDIITTFGQYVALNDPTMERIGTQWLLHYHLCAPHRPTSFWNFLVTTRLIPGNSFTAQDLLGDLREYLNRKGKRSQAPRSIRSTITVFTGTYLKSDGLGQLALLQEKAKGEYYVPVPQRPPIWALGYALAEYWQAHYEGRLTINLDDISGESFAGLFLMGEQGLTDLLIQLKHEGLIDLFRTARPYQVVLLQPDLGYWLDKLYTT